VNVGPHNVIDLFEEQSAEGVGAVEDEAALLELLSESSLARGPRVRHVGTLPARGPFILRR